MLAVEPHEKKLILLRGELSDDRGELRLIDAPMVAIRDRSRRARCAAGQGGSSDPFAPKHMPKRSSENRSDKPVRFGCLRRGELASVHHVQHLADNRGQHIVAAMRALAVVAAISLRHALQCLPMSGEKLDKGLAIPRRGGGDQSLVVPTFESGISRDLAHAGIVAGLAGEARPKVRE